MSRIKSVAGYTKGDGTEVKAHTRLIADAVPTSTTDCDVSLGDLTDFDEDTAMYPRDDWEYEVQNGDTSLGYDEWVEHKEVSDGFYGLDGLTPEQQLSEDRQTTEDAIRDTRELLLEEYPTAKYLILTNSNGGEGSPNLVALRVLDKYRNDLSTPVFDSETTDDEREAAEFEFEESFERTPEMDRDMTRLKRLTSGYERENTWSLNLSTEPADDREAGYEEKAALSDPGNIGANPDFWRGIDDTETVISTPADPKFTEPAEMGWKSVDQLMPTRTELEQQPASHLINRLQAKLDLANKPFAESHKSSTGQGQRDLDLYYKTQAERLSSVITALQDFDARK